MADIAVAAFHLGEELGPVGTPEGMESMLATLREIAEGRLTLSAAIFLISCGSTMIWFHQRAREKADG